MDKKLGNLDPKLKEIYDRVMSTQVTPSQFTTPPPQHPDSNTPSPAPQPAVQPVQQPTLVGTTPPVPQQPQAPQVTKPQTIAAQPFVAEYVNPGKKGIPTTILILCVVLFFIIYALLWIKLFHVSLPIEIPFITS